MSTAMTAPGPRRGFSDEAAAPRAPEESRWVGVGVLAIVDFVAGFALLWDRYPLPGVGQPSGMFVLAVLVILALFRHPTQRNRQFLLIVAVYGAMLAEAVIVSQANHLDWHQRALKMTLLLLFALAVAAGRVGVRNVLAGLVTAMVINIPLFYAGVTPNDYPPYLTGFLGDKNVAGLMYASVGIVGLNIYRAGWQRVVHWAVFGGALWLTGSRTSMAAFACASIWILVRNRVWLGIRLILVGVAVWLLGQMENRYARIGVFADREGTDWFREQIGIATEAKLRATPWFGRGLTTAWVNLDGGRFMWFHDSYAALRVEGGLPMMGLMLTLVVLVAGGLFRVSKVSAPLAVAEGALIVLLVCAGKLGEVFFTTPSFLILGLAWGLRHGVAIDEDAGPLVTSVQAPRPRRALEE